MKISDTHAVRRAFAPSAGATGTLTGLSIDMLGWDRCCFVLSFGATVDATVELQVSEDNTTWLTVTDEAVDVVAETPTIVDTGRLDRRYARLRVVTSSATDIEGGIALLGQPIKEQLPITHDSALAIANKPDAA